MKLIGEAKYEKYGTRIVNYSLDDEMVCAKSISILFSDNKIKEVAIEGGCQGNGVGIARLLKEMSIEEAIERLSGIDCHNKGTSCPDMIARILKEAIK